MKRDRFFSLLRFWHFNDNDLQNPEDRFFKIAAVVDAINRNSIAAMCPGAEVVIDESLIPWRGRLIFRQYIPSKAHKYGVKLYKICSENGYTFKIKIYSEKSDKTAGIGHADDVVRELTTGMLDEGRTVVTDNFYTSLPLARYLQEHETHLIGTLRANRRELPADVIKAKLKRGEVTGQQDQRGIKIISWVDKRRVNMLTTIPEHEATLMDTGRVRRGQRVKKPQCVVVYNRLKKGVDLSDQFSSYYSPLRKSLRWYKKLAVELIAGTAMVNAFLLFMDASGKRMPLLTFREQVARALIGPLKEPFSPSGRPIKHALKERPGQVRNNRKRCMSCYEIARKNGCDRDESRKRSKQVNTYCADCPNEPALCLPCFSLKHKGI